MRGVVMEVADVRSSKQAYRRVVRVAEALAAALYDVLSPDVGCVLVVGARGGHVVASAGPERMVSQVQADESLARQFFAPAHRRGGGVRGGWMMAESIADRLRALEPRLRDNYYRLAAIDELKELADEVERLEDVAQIAQLVYELWVDNHYRDETEDAIEAMQELGDVLGQAGYETPISRDYGVASK